MVRDIEFRSFSDEFQEKLKQDVREIREATELIVEADKTSNHYKLTTEQFKDLLSKNIHKDYKKAAKEDLRRAIEHHKEIVVKHDLEDRMMATQVLI